MTTANLTIVGKENEKAQLWIWHDGYQVDWYFELMMKKQKPSSFEVDDLQTRLRQIEPDDGFVKALPDEGRGDWSWVLTILEEKKAVLVGSGSEGTKVKWYEI